ncbi:GSCFA domain-containing protein [Ancylobacter sp. FA202]|uniref:GSCFA domain-containing protein n=1 Tax=Ancylobacter sp. FA202 TaxID=1111106 RepID=UPI0003661899|nr:GSCFA domain-containing protein [Ancylobacter sp. FA202]
MNDPSSASGATPRDFSLRASDVATSKYATALSGREITLPIKKILGRDDVIFTMGSCFSEEIRKALGAEGFTCAPRYSRINFDRDRMVIDTLPEREHMNFYNTFTILQQLEQITGAWNQDRDDYWVAPKVSAKVVGWTERPLFQDPYKRLVFGKTVEDLHAAVDLVNAEMRASFDEATAFVFTFGMAEVFRNKRNGKIVGQKPNYGGGAGLDETEYHQSDFSENLDNLRSIVRLIRSRKPDAPIFLSVSPVPLERTFGPSDIITANCEGKAILRAAAGQVVREFDGLYYVPSFELVTLAGLDGFREDGRHVRPKVVEQIVAGFSDAYLAGDERESARDTVAVSAREKSAYQHFGDTPRWPIANRDRPEVRYDIDADFHVLYDKALAATQMKERFMRRQRHFLIAKLLPQIRDVPGDMAEVGCFRGLSAYLAASIAVKGGVRRDFHIFDSFEGLSPSATEDATVFAPASPKEGNLFACSEDQVRANLKPFPFIRYYKGWVPTRFHEVDDRKFAYVHVDVDLFEPTRDCLEFFWPRLSPGGILVLDDHGTVFFPGARQAAEAFFRGRRDVVVVETPAGGAAAIKVGDVIQGEAVSGSIFGALRSLWK